MDKDDESSSSVESSSSRSDSDSYTTKSKSGQQSKGKKSEGKLGKRKSGPVDFDALRKHGYKGGLSVLNVPPPKDDIKEDWSWSTGKEHRDIKNKDAERSYEERQKTRDALADGEQLTNMQTSREKKNLSFSQKEEETRSRSS